jgi:hypothetical protein
MPRSLLTLLLLPCLCLPVHADPIRVEQTQGIARGFLTLHSPEGKLLAHGDLIQTAHGDRVTVRLVFHFLDGSLDEETTIFTQRETFHLVSDHHVQRGPFFPKPSDVLVEAATGTVTSRTPGKNGKEKVEVEHMDLPPDTYNGLVCTIMVGLAKGAPAFKIAYIVPNGSKARLVHLAIAEDSEHPFNVTGLTHMARIYRVHVDIGGLAGVIAPAIGKQPADIFIWIFPGEAATIVREVGPLYEGGPAVSIELAGTSFDQSAPTQPAKK